MTIERLTDNPLLPQSGEMILSGDPDRQAQYIRELVGDLESDKLTDIHRRINLILETQNDTIVYLGLKNALGEYDDGTWRINGDSVTEVLIQLKVAGTWTTYFTLSSSGSLTTTGGRIVNTTSIDDTDSPYTMLASDHVILCDTSSGDVTVYLIAPVDGQLAYIKNTGAGVVTVDADTVGSTTIDGDTTQPVNQYECLESVSDTTVWWVI